MLRAAVQVLYAGKKAQLAIGNIKPVGELPEGTIVCNLEAKQARCCTSCSHLHSGARDRPF
jgi:ribosomal protein L2